MKKKLYCSIVCIMLSAAGLGIVVGSAGGIKTSILNNSHYASLRRNTFVIDDQSEYTSHGTGEDAYYTAVALSSQNSLMTMFAGFELSGDQLVLHSGDLGVIANVDPMNVGFNQLSVNLTGNSNNFKYSFLSAFSYFDISDKAAEIAMGGYEDLQTFAHVHVDSTGTVSESVTTAQLPDMSDCRYTLTVILADADLTLNEVVFGTECVAQAPVKTDIGEFSDYRDSEKAAIQSSFGGYLPFVGNGLYYFYEQNNEIFLEGAFGNIALVEPVIDGFTDNDYLPTVNVDPTPYGQIVFQTLLDGVVYTVDVEYCVNEIVTYKIRLSNTEEIHGLYDEWPLELFAQYLTTGFCDILEDNPLDDAEAQFLDVSSLAFPEGIEGENALALLILGYEATSELDGEQVAFLALVSYLSSLVADQTLNFVVTKNETPYNNEFIPGEEYEFSISDGVHSFTAYFDGSLCLLLLSEPDLQSAFPLALINQTLELSQDKSVANYLGTGQFGYRVYSDSINVDVYYTSAASVELYRNALLDSGLYLYGESNDYVDFRSDVFDGYAVSMNFEDVDTLHKFRISFRKNSEFAKYNSFNDALQAYSSDSKVLEHVYPTIQGDHVYRVVRDSYTYRDYRATEGIYVNELDQAYVNDLIANATYNAYYNAYIFEDEYDGNNYFAIRAEVLTGGVRIQPMSLYVDPAYELLDSDQANALLEAKFDELYGDLEHGTPSEQAEYQLYVDAIVYAPASNGNKVYSVSGDSCVEFSIYGQDRETYANAYTQAAITKGYAYSELQNRYYFGNTVVQVSRYDTADSTYNNTKSTIRFMPSGSGYHYVDFVSYANAGLTDIEANFASFPHEDDEEIFYRKSGSNQVVVSGEFDNKQFIKNLLANGFYYYDNSYPGYELRKSVGTALYKVRSDTTMYESGEYDLWSSDPRGLRGYRFEVINNYYLGLNDALDEYMQGTSSTFVQDLLDAIPNYNSDASFHIEAGYYDSIDVNYADSLDKDAFIAALHAKGYVNSRGKDNFIYVGTDYTVNVSFNNSSDQRLFFRYTHYEWKTFPTVAQSADTFYYFASSYIPTPTETGNIVAYIYNYSTETFAFVLKKTCDINDYMSKFVALGYEVNIYRDGGGASFTLRNGPVSINGNYSVQEMGYEFYFYCENYSSLTKQFNLLDVNTFLAYRFGYTGTFLTEDYLINITNITVGKTADERDINTHITCVNSADVELLEEYVVNNTDFIKYNYYEHYYYKDYGNARYSISFDGDRIILSVDYQGA